jgi:hypothetical protein
MKTLKSIGAVLVGIIVLVALATITDKILESTGVFPPSLDQGSYTTGMLLLALTYRCLYQIVGAYITAALAPANPMKHVTILGIIGIVLGIAGVAASVLELVPGFEPSQIWYPIALAILAYPTVWFGGKLRVRNLKSSI